MEYVDPNSKWFDPEIDEYSPEYLANQREAEDEARWFHDQDEW